MLDRMREFFPRRRDYNRYFEPFLGGGAVFFDLSPDAAILSDLNPELAIAYRLVRDDVRGVIDLLRKHSKEHQRDPDGHYEKVRSTLPTDLTSVERAARLIYLNKTCYNGLYRVNRDGMFNVPSGHQRNPNICDETNLVASSKALQTADVKQLDYKLALSDAATADFVYLDPPYHSKTGSTFTAYTEDGFTDQNQEELAKLYASLDSKGCKLLLSNSDSDLVRNLYSRYHVTSLEASRLITCIPSKRGTKVMELLVMNYQPPS